jgi:polyphenol oxidase
LLSQLQDQLMSPLALQWVQQVHGTAVLRATAAVAESVPVADAIYTDTANLVLGVMTADCLPVLFSADDGTEIAIAHAGWRGLCNGVLEATLKNFRCSPAHIRCWLGPAIGPCHFEVGHEVREAFLARAALTEQSAIAAAFQPGERAGKWQGDLYTLARLRLQAAGVKQVNGVVQCTVCHADRFYSYRQQAVTGRFATLIVRSA